jgi:hypothetical protein
MSRPEAAHLVGRRRIGRAAVNEISTHVFQQAGQLMVALDARIARHWNSANDFVFFARRGELIRPFSVNPDAVLWRDPHLRSGEDRDAAVHVEFEAAVGALSRWPVLLVNGATRLWAAHSEINGLQSSKVALDTSRIRYSWPT